jgi:hypothetical protein
MKRLSCWLAVCIAGALLVSAAKAQQPAPPGPEHAKFKELEGTWDATMDMMGQKSTGTMTYKVVMGGYFLASEFKGEFGGMKFEGRGLDTYDTIKKKYVGVWADNMGPAIMMMEGNYDKEGKKLTMVGEGPGQDGKLMKYKSVTVMPDKDTMLFTMSNADDPTGKPMFTITYKRKG